MDVERVWILTLKWLTFLIRNHFFTLTFRIAKDAANDVKSRHHVLGHFSNTNVLGSLGKLVAGVTRLLVVALVADPHGSIPVPAGHGSRFGRTLRTETLPAISTVVFCVGRAERGLAIMAVFNFMVRPPIRRRHLIRNPSGQRFRRLQGNVRDGLGDVGDTVDNPLRGVTGRCCVIRLEERNRRMYITALKRNIRYVQKFWSLDCMKM